MRVPPDGYVRLYIGYKTQRLSWFGAKDHCRRDTAYYPCGAPRDLLMVFLIGTDVLRDVARSCGMIHRYPERAL